MAYDANGKWIPEDAGVADRVSGLIKDNPTFIQRAKTDAARTSNKRGLLNSSIAVQAGEEAAQKAALPIAAQEATQIQQSNLSAQDFTQQTERDIAARTFQASESAATRTSAETQAQEERTARAGLLTTELASRESEGEAERVAREKLTNAGILSNERVAQLNTGTQVKLANLNSETQQYIANLNIQGSERQKATEALVNLAAQYADTFTRIQDNTAIPAAARAQSLEHLAALRDSNFAMIQRLYSFPVEWSSPIFGGAAPPPPPPTGGPGAPPPTAPAPATAPNFDPGFVA